MQHLRHGGAVLRVEVGVDFVEEVEGCRVALLDGEDEGEGAEACCFFVSRCVKYSKVGVGVWIGRGMERGRRTLLPTA